MFIGAGSKREARGMFWFPVRPGRICTLDSTPDSPNENHPSLYFPTLFPVSAWNACRVALICHMVLCLHSTELASN
jgi:hypothetical protein